MIPHFTGKLPFISTKQMNQLEEAMIETYGISRMQMMENAGYGLALLARKKFLSKKFQEKKVVVVAGTGHHAGIALVAARRLHIWGAEVSILLANPKGKFIQETIAQFSICQKMKIDFIEKMGKPDLIIDGILDAGFKGNPDTNTAEFIDMINKSSANILSIEAPSGLDLNTGKPGKPSVKATATLALAIPKTGMFKLLGTKYTGELFLADISVPHQLFASLKIDDSPFKKVYHESSLVKINKVIILN